MKARARALALALLIAGATLASTGFATAGYTTQESGVRMVHLFDAANNVEVRVRVNETLDSNHANNFHFVILAQQAPGGANYILEVAVSPDDPDVRIAWSTNVSVASGDSTTFGDVVIPADYPPGTLPNLPFRFSLMRDNRQLVDSADVGIDVRYHTPPADGGLLQLALATTAFWALVFLYALHLHSNERKLRARADALERSLQGAHKDDPAPGPKR